MAQTISDQYHRARMLTLRMRSNPNKSVANHQDIISAAKNAGAYDAANVTVSERDELTPLLIRNRTKNLYNRPDILVRFSEGKLLTQ